MKILFITNTRIGDAILSTGILNYLLETHPDAKLTIACGEVAAPLFEYVPNLECLIPMRKQKHSLHWLKLWCQCIGTYWDIVVDLRKSAISYCLFKKKVYRHQKSYCGNPHRQYINAAILGLPSPHPLKLFWGVPQATLAKQRLPAKLEHKIVIALAPVANWTKKTWPVESYIRLVDRIRQKLLAGKDVFFVLSCAPNERSHMQPLVEVIPDMHRMILCEDCQLLDVAACFAQCNLFIGNDSGLMHMAHAVGTPTIGLFGPSKDLWYGPLGNKDYVVRTPESFDELMAQAGAYPTRNLMTSLSVDTVYDTVKQCLIKLQII